MKEKVIGIEAHGFLTVHLSVWDEDVLGCDFIGLTRLTHIQYQGETLPPSP